MFNLKLREKAGLHKLLRTFDVLWFLSEHARIWRACFAVALWGERKVLTRRVGARGESVLALDFFEVGAGSWAHVSLSCLMIHI